MTSRQLRTLVTMALVTCALGFAGEKAAVDLSPLDAWKPEKNGWSTVGSVKINPENAKRLTAESGDGLFYNGPNGRAINLLSKQEFGDVALHLEYLIPKGSNSGVKLIGQYEIQIADSFEKTKVTGSDCGGIYPRAELGPKYHHIDDGIAPTTNACAAPGTWQTLDIVFHAPRFDSDGKKTENAKFVSVKLNGVTVQDNVDMPYPTGHAWHNKETARGPILLQADHGPVAFRAIRATELD
jgi:hypothetical protein